VLINKYTFIVEFAFENRTIILLNTIKGRFTFMCFLNDSFVHACHMDEGYNEVYGDDGDPLSL
jgi:hypothetical protein